MYSSISRSPNVGGNIYPRWIRKRQVRLDARGREEVVSGLGMAQEEGAKAKLCDDPTPKHTHTQAFAHEGHYIGRVSGGWISSVSGQERSPSPVARDPRSLTISVNIFCRAAWEASLSISFWVS